MSTVKRQFDRARFFACALLAAFAAASVSCGAEPKAPVIASINVTPSSGTLLSLGASLQLTATVLDDNDAAMTSAVIAWTTTAPSVATVSSTGLVTAVANGSATIQASSGGFTDGASITVTQTMTAVNLTPTPLTLASIGATQQMTATRVDARGNAMSGGTITWNTSAAGVATVSASGLVTAVANGSAIIMGANGGFSGDAAITVAQSVNTVTVTPPTASLSTAGTTQQFTAVGKDANNNTVAGAAFTWTSSATNVGTVNASGLASAVAAGSTTITATSNAKSGTATLTVVPLATITVTPASQTMTSLGANQQLTATPKDGGGNTIGGVTITWTSSNPAVATVSAAGVVSSVTNGSTTITAASGAVNGTATVTVAQALNNIAVTPTPVTIRSIGATETLAGVGKDSVGNTVPGTVVTWTSSAPSVATVGASTGIVTAVTNGTATITATSGTKTGTAAITVAQRLFSVLVSPPTQTAGLVAIGYQYTFSALAKDSLNTTITGRTFTWASSAPAVATVNTTGVTSVVASGTTNITATSSIVTGETAKTGTGVYTVTMDPCQTRGPITLTGVNYTSVGYGSYPIVSSGECNIANFGGTGTMAVGHRWNFNNAIAGSLEFVMVSSALTLNPVLQLRNGSTVVGSSDAGTDFIARFSASPGAAVGTFLLYAGGKTGQTGTYQLFAGKNAADLSGATCAAISVLVPGTSLNVVSGALGDSFGCGTGAANTSDIYIIPIPYASGAKQLMISLDGSGAQAGDLTFKPQFEVFSGDGTNLTLLPFSDNNRLEWQACVPDSSSIIEYSFSRFGSCTSSNVGVTVRGGAPGLLFLRVRASKAGSYALWYKWI